MQVAAGETGLGVGAKRWHRACASLRAQARDFCLVTGLHGYKYIVQPGKHRAERLFWGAVVSLFMAAAIYMMLMAYKFNREHPSLLAVDTTHHPLWNAEVPGITVCPSNKVMRSKARRIALQMSLPGNMTMTADELVEDMGLLVELVFPRSSGNPRLQRLQSILDHNALSADLLLEKVSPTCDELLVRCKWKRRACLKCSDIFRRVRTALGFCCSFNYMDRDLVLHKLVSGGAPIAILETAIFMYISLPRMGGCVGVSFKKVQRLSACGYTNGLSAVTLIDPKEYVTSLLGSYANMVLIHSPWSYPDANADMKLVSAGTVTFISYLTRITEATDRLRSLTPDVRKCLFMEEVYMPMYTNYTYFNCKASLNRTLCNLLDVTCLKNLNIPPPGTKGVYNYETQCQACHPLCSKVEYQVETSIGTLNWNNIPDGDTLTEGLSNHAGDIYGVFHVFPNDLVTTKYKLDLYMTDEDLLGSLGGLSGLFVGFSLVSGFEFLYFFTVRPLFRIWGVRSRAASRGSDSYSSAEGPQSVSPFPLATPSVFRFRRSNNEEDSKNHRKGRYPPTKITLGKKGSVSVIPIIE